MRFDAPECVSMRTMIAPNAVPENWVSVSE
jgi:hypothetical protein